MEQLPCIYSPDKSATVFLGSKAVTVVAGQPHFREVQDAIIAQDWEAVARLVDVITSIKAYLVKDGDFEISREEIKYRNEPVKGVIADRILSFMEKGYPSAPLIEFLRNLMSNPSFNSRNQLYTFLERWNLPITPNGNFLAYKAVRNDYMSIASDRNTGEHVDNSIGRVVVMDRAKIDDNPKNHCSAGLHAGALQYVRWYGGISHGGAIEGGNRAIIVEINPADVVSVPNDHDCQKMRVCKYKVIGDYIGELPTDYTDAAVYDGYEDGDEGDSYDEDDYCPDCGEPYEICNCD